MRVAIKKTTLVMLKLNALYPFSYDEVQDLEGNYLIEISEEVAKGLEDNGADLDNPESINKVVYDLINQF